jgi:hypothetical protein
MLHLKKVAFWNVNQCRLVEAYRHFRGTAASTAWIVNGGNRLQQNASMLLPDYTLFHPRQQAVVTVNAMRTSNLTLLNLFNLQFLLLKALGLTDCSSLCHVAKTSIITINSRVTT